MVAALLAHESDQVLRVRAALAGDPLRFQPQKDWTPGTRPLSHQRTVQVDDAGSMSSMNVASSSSSELNIPADSPYPTSLASADRLLKVATRVMVRNWREELLADQRVSLGSS